MWRVKASPGAPPGPGASPCSASPSSTTAPAICTPAAKAFERAAREGGGEASIAVTADPDDVRAADRIVLPGVGAFADCKAGLDAVPGMAEALEDSVRRKGRPFLGICVGAQLMAERGLEFRSTPGPGLDQAAT